MKVLTINRLSSEEEMVMTQYRNIDTQKGSATPWSGNEAYDTKNLDTLRVDEKFINFMESKFPNSDGFEVHDIIEGVEFIIIDGSNYNSSKNEILIQLHESIFRGVAK